jgi:hypothetical protein
MTRRPLLVKLRLAIPCIAIAFGAIALSPAAAAHSEFQAFVRKNSGRPVDCAMCHVHSNGPEGTGPGQIGSLTPEEMTRLNRARAAFDPGANVDSPILNEFGDLLLQRIGKKRILELRSAPAELAHELGFESDLDQDGVPDAREYLDGTHPLIASDGDPWTLFLHNLRRHGFHLVMICIATAVTLYGLVNLLHGFAVRLRAKAADGDGGGTHG